LQETNAARAAQSDIAYMDDDPIATVNHQPDALLTLTAAEGVNIDQTTRVWGAAEALTSPDLETRHLGLKLLVDQDAVRSQPLVAYLFLSRLTEPDIALRTQIVEALADVVVQNGHGDPSAAPSFPTLTTELMGMRTRQIYALLQVVDFDTQTEPKVAGLLDYCSYAGSHLAHILSSRTLPLSLRKQAAHFIGRIGYLDALPALERMAARLETRCNGRSELGESNGDDAELLSLIHSSLDLLRAP
jgi:hypothetical protein